jgi:hypothetical protein
MEVAANFSPSPPALLAGGEVGVRGRRLRRGVADPSWGEFPNTGEREFTAPAKGELLDWVLVLDDAAKTYPVPGSRK